MNTAAQTALMRPFRGKDHLTVGDWVLRGNVAGFIIEVHGPNATVRMPKNKSKNGKVVSVLVPLNELQLFFLPRNPVTYRGSHWTIVMDAVADRVGPEAIVSLLDAEKCCGFGDFLVRQLNEVWADHSNLPFPSGKLTQHVAFQRRHADLQKSLEESLPAAVAHMEAGWWQVRKSSDVTLAFEDDLPRAAAAVVAYFDFGSKTVRAGLDALTPDEIAGGWQWSCFLPKRLQNQHTIMTTVNHCHDFLLVARMLVQKLGQFDLLDFGAGSGMFGIAVNAVGGADRWISRARTWGVDLEQQTSFKQPVLGAVRDELQTAARARNRGEWYQFESAPTSAAALDCVRAQLRVGRGTLVMLHSLETVSLNGLHGRVLGDVRKTSSGLRYPVETTAGKKLIRPANLLRSRATVLHVAWMDSAQPFEDGDRARHTLTGKEGRVVRRGNQMFLAPVAASWAEFPVSHGLVHVPCVPGDTVVRRGDPEGPEGSEAKRTVARGVQTKRLVVCGSGKGTRTEPLGDPGAWQLVDDGGKLRDMTPWEEPGVQLLRAAHEAVEASGVRFGPDASSLHLALVGDYMPADMPIRLEDVVSGDQLHRFRFLLRQFGPDMKDMAFELPTSMPNVLEVVRVWRLDEAKLGAALDRLPKEMDAKMPDIGPVGAGAHEGRDFVLEMMPELLREVSELQDASGALSENEWARLQQKVEQRTIARGVQPQVARQLANVVVAGLQQKLSAQSRDIRKQ